MVRVADHAPYKIFISHATADKWIAIQICNAIDAINGVTTFRDDRDIDGGDDIPEMIGEHIRSSDEMVLLLTPESVDRQWPLLELGAAALGVSRTIRITVVLCHVAIDPIPPMLRSKKAIPLNEFDSFLKQLSRRATERNHD
jgi:hypothetical protein